MKDAPDMDRPDEDLVRAIQADPLSAGGRAMASELFARHQRRVYLWCHQHVRERERALDLTQDVFARAWKALPGFAFRSKFSWWLFVITRNCCLNAVTAPSLLRDDEVDPDALSATGPDPAERHELETDEESVRQLMMEHLDEQERLALWLGCFERMPVDAITRALGLSNATGARGLMQRARRKLRAALEARDREREV